MKSKLDPYSAQLYNIPYWGNELAWLENCNQSKLAQERSAEPGQARPGPLEYSSCISETCMLQIGGRSHLQLQLSTLPHVSSTGVIMAIVEWAVGWFGQEQRVIAYSYLGTCTALHAIQCECTAYILPTAWYVRACWENGVLPNFCVLQNADIVANSSLQLQNYCSS